MALHNHVARPPSPRPRPRAAGPPAEQAPDGRLLGGQIVGTEGAAKRIDVLATWIWSAMAVDELELLDLSYAPPYSGVYDPLLVAARAATKVL